MKVRRDPWIVLALGLVLFLPGLGAHDLWNPDEPRYAEVAREMRASGEYLVPQLNGAVYTQKPPLLFWLINAAALLTGEVDETAARLPSAAAAIASLVLVYLLGRLLFDRRAAWLAVLCFATLSKVLWQGHVGQIDMLLACLVLLAVYLWARGWVEERPDFFPWFFVATGFATLAKGPAGFLPPFLAIAVFLLMDRDFESLRQLRPGRGLLLWAAIPLAWLLAASWIAGGDYLQELLFKQNLTRYANPWHHHQPFYYYLTVLPGDAFPWSFFLPAAVVTGWRSFTGATWRRFAFLLTWIVVTLVFFSLSPGKRSVYIFSMYPALALVAGAGLGRLAETHRLDRRWLSWPAGALALVFAGLAVALPLLGPERPEAKVLPPKFALEAGVMLALLALGLAVAWWEARRERIVAFTAAVAAGMAAAVLFGFLRLAPPLDAFKSSRPLAETLVRLAGPGEPYAIYPRLNPAFLFYSRRHAVDLDQNGGLDAFLARPGRIWLLAERDELAGLEAPLPLVEAARDTDVVEGYVLFTSPPWPHVLSDQH